LAVHEGVAVAVMWDRVIRDACDDVAALGEAEPTEWFLFELSLTAASP
jgi:hypothetical protein